MKKQDTTTVSNLSKTETSLFFTTPDIDSVSIEEQKKIEEIRPVLKNLISHIVEKEITNYLNEIYAKK